MDEETEDIIMMPTEQMNHQPLSKIDLRKKLDEFDHCVDEQINKLSSCHVIDGNEDIDRNYWETYAAAKLNSDPSANVNDIAKFAAESIIRTRTLNIIKDKTCELRNIPSDAGHMDEYNKCADTIDKAADIYNSMMGRECIKHVVRRSQSTITESVAAPNMIVFGRQYDEPTNDGPSVIERFNMMVAQNDPYTGSGNAVMQRLAEFAHNNESKYSVDENPELDDYVTTLFIDPDMGPEAFEINGENPYRVAEKIKDGEYDEPIVKASPVNDKSNVENESDVSDKINDDFLNNFGTLFNA